LVVEEQKVRSLSGGAFNTRDPYLIQIQASLVDKKDMQYVKDEIMKAIDLSKTKEVDIKALDDAKSRLRYGFAMEMDSPSAIAESLSFYTWVTGDPESLNKAYANYEKVTPTSIIEVAKKYYESSKLTIATISDQENCPVK
jgi:zinc protease